MTKFPEATVLACVAGAGGIGGAVSEIIPFLAPTFGQTPSSWLAIPAAILVGAVVAVVGVFILFNTNQADRIRLIALGLLCGILWQPTLQMAQTALTGAKQRSDDNKALKAVQDVARAVPATQPAGITSAAVTQNLNSLTEVGARLTEIHDPQIKAIATTDFLAAVDKLDTTLGKATPDVRKKNLDAIIRLHELPAIRENPELHSAMQEKINGAQ